VDHPMDLRRSDLALNCLVGYVSTVNWVKDSLMGVLNGDGEWAQLYSFTTDMRL